MIIKGHGITSWQDLLSTLKINTGKLQAKDLKCLREWCCEHIQSNFPVNSSLQEIERKVQAYLALNSQDAPSTVVDPDIGLNVIQKAAKLDFDSFINELLSLYNKNDKKTILNSVTHIGNTPLHYAALYGHKNSLKVLLQHGADANLVNNHSKLPINLAATPSRNNAEVKKDCVRLLLPKTQTNSLILVDDTGMSLLLNLTYFDDVALVSAVLEKNEDLLTMMDKQNQNVLHHAVINNKKNLVNFFSNNNKLISQKTLNNSTVLHLACRYADESIIRSLFSNPLCNNADCLGICDEHGNTALDYLPSKDIIADLLTLQNTPISNNRSTR
jgi:uncharacterized protein